MFRNSNMYRRLWYAKKRKSGVFHIWFKLIFIIIILLLLISYAQKKIQPYALEFAESKIKTVITSTVKSVINEALAGDVKYENLIDITDSEDGRATLLQTDNEAVNRLLAEVSIAVQQNLNRIKNDETRIPVGVILGGAFFSDIGPGIKICIDPAGSAEAGLSSEFTSVGLSRTRHKIYIQVKTKVEIVAPLVVTEAEIITVIPIEDINYPNKE